MAAITGSIPLLTLLIEKGGASIDLANEVGVEEREGRGREGGRRNCCGETNVDI